MDIKPIKTEEDYQAALEEIRSLFHALPDTPEGDRLEVLAALVKAYEKKHYPIPLPDPIEAIEYYMESRGLSRQDLEPYIGSRARVSEILNRRRRLTLRMIRNLEAGLGIPAGILVQQYSLVSTEERVAMEQGVQIVQEGATPVAEQHPSATGTRIRTSLEQSYTKRLPVPEESPFHPLPKVLQAAFSEMVIQ